MKIVIRNYLAASFLLEQEPKTWDAIVILDSGLVSTPFVAEHSRRHLYLRFDDVVANVGGKRPPTIDDLRAANEFAADSENLIVSCRAGQSRSAAIAFVIGCERLGSEAARRLLNPARHIPNSLIVELGAELSDEPFVLQAFDAWRTANKDIQFLNHMDEIERELDELQRKGARNRIVSL
jgi:predicted protein tyrosine phosphatase